MSKLLKRPFFNAFGNAKLAVAVLLIIVVIETILVICLGVGLALAPSKVKIEQQNCNGTTTIIDPHTISPTRVLNFTSQEWIKLNSWPQNGTTDSLKNLKAEDAYLTPSFVNQYKQSLKSLKKKGYLDDYVVVTIPIQSEDRENVIAKDGGWFVRQKFISRFYYNPSNSIESDVTKDSRVEYKLEQDITFYVVQYPNGEGLAIDHIANVDLSDTSDEKETLDSGAK